MGAQTSNLPTRVVIFGAGTMGSRIAVCFARNGVSVTVCDIAPSARQRAGDTIQSVLAEPTPVNRRRVRDGGADLVTPERPEDVSGRIELTADAGDALACADLVIEAIAENIVDKVELLERIQACIHPDAIVTSNTSSLDLGVLAGAVSRPARFAGLHWFNPPDLVELVEIVPAPETGASTIDTLRAWMAELGKTPVALRRAVPGFVANRLQYALIREAYALVAAGVCTWADADLAVTSGLGPRWAAVGPFESMDLAGLDIHLAVVRALFPELAHQNEPSDALVDLVAAGRLGAKSGSGLLGDYPQERLELLLLARDTMLRCVAEVRAESVFPQPNGLIGQITDTATVAKCDKSAPLSDDGG